MYSRLCAKVSHWLKLPIEYRQKPRTTPLQQESSGAVSSACFYKLAILNFSIEYWRSFNGIQHGHETLMDEYFHKPCQITITESSMPTDCSSQAMAELVILVLLFNLSPSL